MSGAAGAEGAPRVGIVVLNYENAEDTVVCVDSLSRLHYHPFDVFVVDNASSRGVDLLQAIPRRHPDVRLILNDRNAGYAAGNNVGIRAALDGGCAYVLVINNDTEVPPDLLHHLVDALEADARAVVAMPRFLDEAGADVTQVRPRPTYWSYYGRFGAAAALRKWRRRRAGVGAGAAPAPRRDYGGHVVPIEVPMGACMMLRGSFLRDIGLLDEGTFLYQEEVILAEQARRLDRTMLLVPGAEVIHLGGRSTRNFKLRRTLALWRSQNYYLREYRGVDPVRRWALVGYQAAAMAGTGAVGLLRRAVRGRG